MVGHLFYYYNWWKTFKLLDRFIANQSKNLRNIFVTLAWTCYVNWAILIGEPVDVTSLLLHQHQQNHDKSDQKSVTTKIASAINARHERYNSMAI